MLNTDYHYKNRSDGSGLRRPTKGGWPGRRGRPACVGERCFFDCWWALFGNRAAEINNEVWINPELFPQTCGGGPTVT